MKVELIKYLILVLIISFLSACKTDVRQDVAEKEGFQIKKYHYQQSDSLSDYLKADINYFQLIADCDFANVINNLILNEYQGMVEGNYDNPNILINEYFKLQAASIDTLIKDLEIDDFNPYSFDYTAEVVVNNDSLFTFKRSFYYYTGGAHGNLSKSYSNYFIKSIDKLELTDLFSEKELIVLTKMGERAFRLAQKVPKNKSLKVFGYEFENGFYLSKNFLLTDKSIVFYYAPYEIACYAMGDSGFEISYESIRAKMPDARLFQFVK
jgi:hypothetical protein